ncbi:hypothetical protein L596_002178 [Steinernema carpocapsae]|uniref:Uncharacterized protein n=1 Tax=Steinernema carpocapsae TaxID=34508 RepID=A0A4U8UND2_STECR|nr:hypothetical protein L596_002178 [Steinernema carpocapsae]
MPAPAILEPLLPKLLLTGSEEQCSASEKIVTNKWFLIEQGVAIVLDIAALFSLVLACIRVRRKFRSLHPSVQILLFNMNVLIVLRTLVTFVRSSTNSYLWLAGKVFNLEGLAARVLSNLSRDGPGTGLP